jgi:cell division protein FtsA
MPLYRKNITALELGTTRVRAMTAQVREDQHLKILGLGECESQGVCKSEVTDMAAATKCARTALERASANSEEPIQEVYLAISGGHILSTQTRGRVTTRGSNRIVQREDVQHVIAAARSVSLPADQEVMHTIGQHFAVDHLRGVLKPEGLVGHNLELNMLVVHGNRTRLANSVMAAMEVPVEIVDVAFSGLCAALAVLSPEQKESGAVVIDLGGGTTSFLAYSAGVVAAAGCLAVGGDHLTNDVSIGLRIQRNQAAEVKEHHGSAMVEVASRSHRLELDTEGGLGRRYFRMGDLHSILQLRMEELFELVKQRLDKLNLLHHIGSGVVLTGAGSSLRRATDLARRVFGLPCEIGTVRDISGLSLGRQIAEYAVPVGMLRYAVRTAAQEGRDEGWRRYLETLRNAWRR